MQRVIESALGRWAGSKKPTHGIAELKGLAINVIGANVLGLEGGPRLDTLRAKYEVLTLGMGALPVPLPGSAYQNAVGARDEILAILREEVERTRKEPASDSGLGRMLAAKAKDGSSLDDDAAVLELHHVVVAGYIVFAELARALSELSSQHAIRGRIATEVRSVSPSGALGTAELSKLSYTLQVVKELKRVTPIIPVVFGKAKKTFELSGKRIPEGWMLLWAPHSSMLWSKAFAAPEKFDPERFSSARREDRDEEIVFVPQGPGKALGHKCPGTDYATLFMQMFVALLVRGYEWELPEQDLNLCWDRIPPEPKDGLQFTLTRVSKG